MSENKHGFKPKQEFTMGGIAWTIIQTGEDWVKCITSDCVEKRAFDTENKNNFSTSSVRAYLNGEFLRRLILAGAPEEAFEYFDIDLTADDGLKDYGGDHVRIGLITCEEYRILRGNIPALPGHLWWTATAESPINSYVRHVYSSGYLGSYHAYIGTPGVRPICVLKSEILASYLGNKNCRVSARTVDQSADEPGAEILCNAKMDAKKFLEEWQRMCDSRKDKCESCLVVAYCQYYSPSGWDGTLDDSLSIDDLISRVEQWSKEHPRKTRLQDFLEKYPNAPRNKSGTPKLMPWNLGYCGDTFCYDCEKGAGKTPAWCWEQEVEDDETD